jgi:hypothetical protein
MALPVTGMGRPRRPCDRCAVHDPPASRPRRLGLVGPARLDSLVNLFFLLYLLLKAGTPGSNRYGPQRETAGWEKVVGGIGIALMVVALLGIIAFITDAAPVQRILKSSGEPAAPPPIAPDRGPPAWEDDPEPMPDCDPWPHWTSASRSTSASSGVAG